jgi:hypothetical protein
MLAGALALGSCSLGGDEEGAEPVTGSPKQVARVVQELDGAIRAGDWRAVCEDLFSSGARRRAGGRDCPRLLRSTAGDVRRPRIELLAIQIEGARATVEVRTRAAGQPPLEDSLELVRERGAYRVHSLAGS